MHLWDRGLFDVNPLCWIDLKQEVLTFPLWSPIGFLVGYQFYDWRARKLRCNEGRYFTRISPSFKPLGIWGMEWVLQGEGPLLILEGIWDAIRAIGAGYRACALLTATPAKELLQWFHMLSYWQDTVVVADNDGAGNHLRKLGRRSITVEGAKDLNALSPSEAKSFLQRSL
jgi:hypothetical protein